MKFHNHLDNPAKRKLSIILPPPNVTGKLHLGHFLDHILPDALARSFLISSRDISWVLSMDHAGIATENVVKRKHGVVTDENLAQEIAENKDNIRQQILSSKLSINADAAVSLFTLDADFVSVVNDCVAKLHEQGLLFRDKYIVNWCYCCATTLSDEEVQSESRQTKMYSIKYSVVGSDDYVIVNTTRPETIFADICLISKYESTISEVKIPLCNKKIPVHYFPQAFDDDLDGDFIKITPSFSKIDFDIAAKLKLSTHSMDIFDNYGCNTMLNYLGKTVMETRQAVIQELNEQKLIVSTNVISSSLPLCYRCHNITDYKISDQLFIDLKSIVNKYLCQKDDNGLSSPLLHTLINDEVLYKQALEWLKNADRWCVSRQIKLGIAIPLYICEICKKFIISTQDKNVCCSQSMKQTTDVFDTWFSSALTGVVLYKKYGQQDILCTGKDILFFWVIRMIALDMVMLGKPSMKFVFFHGLIKDNLGRKLSKSLNNSPDLETLKQEYGLDALRYYFYKNYSKREDIKFIAANIKNDFSKLSNKLDSISFFVGKICLAHDYTLASDTLDKFDLPAYDNFFSQEDINDTDRGFAAYVFLYCGFILNSLKSGNFKEAMHFLYCLIFDHLSREFLAMRHRSGYVSYSLDQTWRVIVETLYPFMPDKALELLPDLFDESKMITGFNRNFIEDGIADDITLSKLYAYVRLRRVVNILILLQQNKSINKDGIFLTSNGQFNSSMIYENRDFLSRGCNMDLYPVYTVDKMSIINTHEKLIIDNKYIRIFSTSAHVQEMSIYLSSENIDVLLATLIVKEEIDTKDLMKQLLNKFIDYDKIYRKRLPEASWFSWSETANDDYFTADIV